MIGLSRFELGSSGSQSPSTVAAAISVQRGLQFIINFCGGYSTVLPSGHPFALPGPDHSLSVALIKFQNQKSAASNNVMATPRKNGFEASYVRGVGVRPLSDTACC